MEEVRKMDNGKVYPRNYKKAGSHAAKAKIGAADEFDVNMPLNLLIKKVRDRGYCGYTLAYPVMTTFYLFICFQLKVTSKL